MLCDNISSTYLTANPVHHERSKYIVVDYHFVWKCVSHGDLVARYVSTQFQLVDIFSKGLSSHQFSFLKANMSIRFSPVSIEGV